MNWWDASWLAPLNDRSAKERAAHEAALAILEDHAATGRPFALFLHTFHMRQYCCQRPDGSGALLLEAHLDRTLRAVGARLIKVQAPGRDFSVVLSVGVPALVLDNATWLSAVKALMARSEMIVSECEFLSPGVLAELQALTDLQKFDRTILVLPSPPLEFIGNEKDVQVFARAIHQHELVVECPAQSFVFRDLIHRIGRIARIASTKRLKLIEIGGLDKEVAVSFRGVPQGLEELAGQYAREKNVGAAYFAGSRAVMTASLAFGLERSLRLKLRIANRYSEAGDIALAVTEFDEIEKEVGAAGATIDPATGKRLLAATRQSRMQWLATLFEQLQLKGQNAELWQLATSQASSATARHDARAMAQCFSWMSVAALLLEHYDDARESAEYAATYARVSKDRFREGFASVYLGHAQRRLEQNTKALISYLTAIKRLPSRKIGRIHVVARLSAAEMAEELRPIAEAKPLFESAKTMAQGMNYPDLLAAAEAGLARLASPPTN